MRCLLAVGLALFAVIMAEGVAGYEDWTAMYTGDWYMEKYYEQMRIAAKDSMDEKFNAYWTIEQRECEKQDVKDGYLFHMHFLAYASDSKGKMMTKDCNISMHFYHDGKTEPKSKGPQCKDV